MTKSIQFLFILLCLKSSILKADTNIYAFDLDGTIIPQENHFPNKETKKFIHSWLFECVDLIVELTDSLVESVFEKDFWVQLENASYNRPHTHSSEASLSLKINKLIENMTKYFKDLINPHIIRFILKKQAEGHLVVVYTAAKPIWTTKALSLFYKAFPEISELPIVYKEKDRYKTKEKALQMIQNFSSPLEFQNCLINDEALFYLIDNDLKNKAPSVDNHSDFFIHIPSNNKNFSNFRNRGQKKEVLSSLREIVRILVEKQRAILRRKSILKATFLVLGLRVLNNLSDQREYRDLDSKIDKARKIWHSLLWEKVKEPQHEYFSNTQTNLPTTLDSI